MDLRSAREGVEYIIRSVATGVKDGRYSIDKQLAGAIGI